MGILFCWGPKLLYILINWIKNIMKKLLWWQLCCHLLPVFTICILIIYLVIEIYIDDSHVIHFIQWLWDIYSDQNYECWVASFDKNCDIKIDAIISCMTMKVVLQLLEVHKTAHNTEYNGFLNKYMSVLKTLCTSRLHQKKLFFALKFISHSGCYIPNWLLYPILVIGPNLY